MGNQQSVDKNKRRDEARARALNIQKEQERRERRSRIIILASVIVGLALVVTLAVIILSKAPKDIDPDITSMPADVSAPAVASDVGGFLLHEGKVVETVAEDVPVFDLYFDYMCSHCAQFEVLHNDFLMDKQEAGDMAVQVHPIAILNASASYVRGSVYAYLLENATLEQAQQYSLWAFENQTNTGIDGSNTLDFLKGLGLSDSEAKAAIDGDYERFVQAASVITINDESLRAADGSFGTPAFFFNNERIDINYNDAQALQEEINTRIEAAKQS